MVRDHLLEMQKKHKVIAEYIYEPVQLERGYANRTLHIDVGTNLIETRPVSEQMKQLWTGGKGFDIWLMFNIIKPTTKWDSPENPICFSSGPLGGTVSFPGSGKTLVTSISPTTHSIIDSNVGGYFGPYLKFAGFDALTLVGKADKETLIFIDAPNNRVTIEHAPMESIDSHILAEELTEMYSVSELDKRNIAVVSAGRAADHVLIGVLNFSFYDWRRKVPRLKQAGRGGIGTVFRNKNLKALVIKNKDYIPAWKISDTKIADMVTPKVKPKKQPNVNAIRQIINKWNNDPEYVIEMMQDMQDVDKYISSEAIDEINTITGVPKGELYHIATFYSAFSLEPRGEEIIQVCTGTACHVKRSRSLLEALERELKIKQGQTTSDGKYTLEAVACLGCCSLAPVIKIGEDVFGNVKTVDIPRILKGKRG
jgi:NADH:ubiquinone oxidoreductase subunit E